MLDPFSLQPFASFQIPTVYSFKDYVFFDNLLLGVGRDNFLIYELDYELKRQKGLSLFGQQAGMYEEIRSAMIQPEIIFKKPQGVGKLFKKYITIRSALEKHGTFEGMEEEKKVSHRGD